MHNTSQTMTYPSNIPIHFSIIKILQVHLAAHCQAQHIYIYITYFLTRLQAHSKAYHKAQFKSLLQIRHLA